MSTFHFFSTLFNLSPMLILFSFFLLFVFFPFAFYSPFFSFLFTSFYSIQPYLLSSPCSNPFSCSSSIHSSSSFSLYEFLSFSPSFSPSRFNSILYLFSLTSLPFPLPFPSLIPLLPHPYCLILNPIYSKNPHFFAPLSPLYFFISQPPPHTFPSPPTFPSSQCFLYFLLFPIYTSPFSRLQYLSLPSRSPQ